MRWECEFFFFYSFSPFFPTGCLVAWFDRHANLDVIGRRMMWTNPSLSC
jgi:hypothetical protein